MFFTIWHTRFGAWTQRGKMKEKVDQMNLEAKREIRIYQNHEKYQTNEKFKCHKINHERKDNS